MLAMANQKRGDAVYQDFGDRASKRRDRSVEPKNGGPTRSQFVQVVGRLAKDGEVRGTVLKRLHQKNPV